MTRLSLQDVELWPLDLQHQMNQRLLTTVKGKGMCALV